LDRKEHPRVADPSREELVDLYKVAVDEYRFQVNLNWDRSKYFLAFNTAVIGVGTGLIKVGNDVATPLLVGIFAVGLVAAGLSSIAVSLQHGYYHSTRDRMLALAAELEIDTRGVASTPGARGERDTFIARLGKVQNILYLLLLIAAALDVIGMIYVLTR
jgi:hypothetical protein